MSLEDDDFYLNENELEADYQPTLLDEAKRKAVDHCLSIVETMKSNIELNEYVNFENNLEVLSSIVANLIDLSAIDDKELSDEELEEKITQVYNKSTEISYSNIDTILGADQLQDAITKECQKGSEPEDDDTFDGGTDF